MRNCIITMTFMLTSVIQSCSHDTVNLDELRIICFDTEVLPIFQSGCAITNCHDVTAREGLRLDTYLGILEGVEPGNSVNSEIYRAITSRSGEQMPPDYPIQAEARMLIRIWIDQGAEETICLVPPDSIAN